MGLNVDGWCMSSLDFVRAMNERPWLVRVLCRLFMGRYAYREFLFMVENMRRDGFGPFDEYGLEGSAYHQDQQPLRWWLG